VTVLLGLVGGLVFYFRDRTPSSQEARQIVEDARTLLEKGRPDDALTCLAPLLDSPTQSADALELGGMASLQQQAPERARQLWSRLPPQSPAWGRIGLAYAKASLAAADWDTALRALRRFLNESPKDLAALEELRWLDFNLLRSSEALAVLERKLEAGDLQALIDLLETEHRRQIPQEGLKTLQAVDGQLPGQQSVGLALGVCYWQLGEIGKAEKHLLAASRKGDDAAYATLTVSAFLLERGQIDAAETLLQTLQTEGDKGPVVPPALRESYWLLKSDIDERRARYDQALPSLDRAIALGPVRKELLVRRSGLLRLLRRPEEAAAAARRAERLESQERRLWEMVDAGTHRNPTPEDCQTFSDLCDELGRPLQARGWLEIRRRLASSGGGQP